MLILSALYKQVKISVDPGLAESFKAACLNSGVSMAAELSTFMAVRAGAMTPPAPMPAKHVGYDSRSKRRYHVSQILTQLEAIKRHEDTNLARIPDNFQSGSTYENAQLAIDNLEQAIDLLMDAY